MSMMTHQTPEWLKQILFVLSQRGIASAANVEGCSECEIVEISKNCLLPLRYREFLEVMGKGAGTFFLGTDIFYPSIVGLTEDAASLVSEDPTGITLPEDAVVFSMHQGYEMMFFRTNDGEDPPVYYYMERSGRFQQKYVHFSEYLMICANE